MCRGELPALLVLPALTLLGLELTGVGCRRADRLALLPPAPPLPPLVEDGEFPLL